MLEIEPSSTNSLQCFNTVGWASGRAYCLKKTEWWGAGVVICLERGADLHMAQLIPLPLTVSCISKIQIGFTFLVPAYPGSPGQRAVKRVCVCASTLLVGRQVEHPAYKNWVMRCWCGCLSGARCRLFAYDPADATSSPNPTGLSRLS